MENSENKGVAPFDANSSMQQIKDKIKSAFVDMIPDAQWEEMVKTEIEIFFSPVDSSSHNHRYNNNKQQPSPFSHIVAGELENLAKEKLQAYMVEQGNQVFGYAGAKDTMDNIIIKAIKEASSQIFSDVISREVSMRLRNGR